MSKKMRWKTAFHRLKKHENSFLNDLIPQWHFLSKGLLLRVIQTGVCITWNGSLNLGHFVIFHSRKSVAGCQPPNNSVLLKVRSFPTKIEWDLTNGPLSKLLELLDTQVEGSVQWVLLEISWIISSCILMSLWFSNPTWDSRQKPHWDFIQEALLTGSAGTADTVHIVLRGTGNEVTRDFPKSSRLHLWVLEINSVLTSCWEVWVLEIFCAGHD